MVQAPLSSRSADCAWDPYLFHLFEVIIQLGALSPANLLADQLLGRRKEACEGTGGDQKRLPRTQPLGQTG